MVETNKGNDRLTFKYDYQGRRVEKCVYSDNTLTSRTLFVYDGFKCVEELDALNSNAVAMRHAWQPFDIGLNVILAAQDSNGTLYFLHDANKNIMQKTNNNVFSIDACVYAPFGKNKKSLLNIGFSSEFVDTQESLVCFNYRYYMPKEGRWIRRDPIEEKGGINIYSLLNNDAINYTDSNGLANVCCDQAQLPWPQNLLRHCEISEGECPPGRDWTPYPISVDKSPDRKMDNGKSCKCAKEEDIKNCMKRNPYSAGEGRWGSNCQTSVIKTLAMCCMKSTWRPNIYAGNPRGWCTKYIIVYSPDPFAPPVPVCIEWAYPEWRE